jgi:PEP-CTERM motif-containing protein
MARAKRSVVLVVTAALLLGGVLAAPLTAAAIPSLQLDIAGGRYDAATQTIVAAGNPFTLYAYLNSPHSTNHNSVWIDYYISAAIVPKTLQPGGDFGSFLFNGQRIRVTADMVFGSPPIELAHQAHDPGDLAPHGIFDTYFTEFTFRWNLNDRANPYNTAETPGLTPTANPDGSMYYRAFQIDTSDLNPGYAIHFDLYNAYFRLNGDRDTNAFAPFSHDAQSVTSPVPEPSVLAFLGIALVVAGMFVGRRNPRVAPAPRRAAQHDR